MPGRQPTTGHGDDRTHLEERPLHTSFRLPRRNDTRAHERVDVTIDGITRTVEIPAERRRAPADWDRARTRAATAGTALVVAGALVWSVAAIGDLLTDLAPASLAYGIAAVFDLAWIMCMTAEYELRYQPSRQRGPRTLGWVLLAVSITVIFLHGVRVADVVVALAGSVIAVLAKVLWHMRVGVNRRTLNPATQAWLDAELDDAEAALLVLAARRRIGRAHARVAAELDALGLPSGTSVPVSRTPSRAVLHAVPDGRDTGDAAEDKLMPVARDIVGNGPVPSRKTLQDRLREAGHNIGTDRAQRLVLALRDETRDAPGTGTAG